MGSYDWIIMSQHKAFFALHTFDRTCLNCGQDYCAHDVHLWCPFVEVKKESLPMNEYVIKIAVKHTANTLNHLSDDELVNLLVDLRLQIDQLNEYVEGRLGRPWEDK